MEKSHLFPSHPLLNRFPYGPKAFLRRLSHFFAY